MRKSLCIVMIVVWLAGFSRVQAATPIVYVNAAAPGPTQDGTSWATAFQSLQVGLSAAGLLLPANSQVWVATGNYSPTTIGDPTASFVLRNQVAVFGGFAGNEPATFNLAFRNFLTNPTVLEGNIGFPGVNSFHVVTAPNGTLPSAQLDGFTIENGNANNNIGVFGVNNLNGGGMQIGFPSAPAGPLGNSQPTLANLIFNSNRATGEGAGVEITTGNPLITFNNCTFLSNVCAAQALKPFGPIIQGGGVNANSPTVFNNCSFITNSATNFGGGLNVVAGATTLITCSFTSNTAGSGGGMNTNAQAALTGSSFLTNAATTFGGGLFLEPGSAGSTVTTSSFTSNTAAQGGGVAEQDTATFTADSFITNTATMEGGGMDVFAPSIINSCTFTNNSAIGFAFGGGLNAHALCTIDSTTFTGNIATLDGGGINVNSGGLIVTKSKFISNTGIQGGGVEAVAVTTFTDCDFINNATTAGVGGGVQNNGGLQTLTRCVFDSNKAVGNGGGVWTGGGETIVNCVFFKNNAANGGGYRADGGGPTSVTNCTFFDNTTAGTGSAISLAIGTFGLTLKATNCIFWGNNPNVLPAIDDPLQNVTFSDVQGVGYAGLGNISADPLFVNPGSPPGPDGVYRTTDDGLELSAPTKIPNTDALFPGSTTAGSNVLTILTLPTPPPPPLSPAPPPALSTLGLFVGAQLASPNPGNFPAGTTIVAVGANTVTLSAPAGTTFSTPTSPPTPAPAPPPNPYFQFAGIPANTTLGSAVMTVPSNVGFTGGMLLLPNAGPLLFPANTTIVALGGANSLFMSNNAIAATPVGGVAVTFQTSPCVDTGTLSPPAPATDIIGVAHPPGVKVDMGAYEFAFPPIIISGMTTAQQDLILLDSEPAKEQVKPLGTALAIGIPPAVPLTANASILLTQTAAGTVTIYEPNGIAPAFTWSQFSGPGTVTFAPAAAGPFVPGPFASPTTVSAAATTTGPPPVGVAGNIVTNTVTMSFSAPGTYSVQVKIGNGAQAIFSTIFIQVIQLSTITFVSGPIAIPSGVALGQSTQFFVAAQDPNGDALNYLWNFGDGTSSTLQNPTHTYLTAGTFQVSVSVTDPTTGASTTGFVTVNVIYVAPPGAPGYLGSYADSDGDGFPDELEIFLGSSPFDAGSTPTGGPAAVIVPFNVPSNNLKIRLNFAKKSQDTISLSGTIPRTGLTPTNGQAIVFDIGGVLLKFTLDERGRASLTSNGNTGAKAIGSLGNFRTLGTRNSRFSLRVKGNFQAIYAATYATPFGAGGGLVNATVSNVRVVLRGLIFVNNILYDKPFILRYSAKAGRSGSTSRDSSAR